jgi:hypothetical protein
MSLIVDGTTGVTFNDSSLQGAAASPYVLKNRIINGDMRIDQRNAGASVTLTSGGIFTIDRFDGVEDTDGAMTAQQDTSAPTGFINSLKFTTTTADGTLGATQWAACRQMIEGTNISDLGWGTADAKTVTLSFWVRSSLTGTFGGALTNGAFNRSYPFTYSISVANTWEYKTVTISGDTSGTWATTTAIGIRVQFGLGVGSTYSGTAGAWAGAGYLSATGATSVIGTNGATWYVTGVQLEIGTSATPFERRLYSAELAMCQRYYYKWLNDSGGFVYPFSLQSYSASAAYGKFFDLPVTMRATPTCSASGTFEGVSSSGSTTTAFTGLSINSPTKNTLSTNDFTGSSGMSAGQCQPTRVSNNAFIQASAEL